MILKLALLFLIVLALGCLRANVNPATATPEIAAVSAAPTAVPSAIITPPPTPSPFSTFEPTAVPSRVQECTRDSDCIVTGCSDSVCASEEVFDICSYKQEYACYDMIKCGCNNGVCAWNQTDLFRSCVEDARIRQKEVFPPGLPYT